MTHSVESHHFSFSPKKLNSLAHGIITIPLTVFRAILMLTRHQNRIKLLIIAFQTIRLQGLSVLWDTFQRLNSFTLGYGRWVSLCDTLDEDDYSAIKAHIEALSWQPLISVVMPVYNTSERWLRQAVESVRSQLYPSWELCIADDASTDERVKAILNEYSQLDRRIKVIYRKLNGHISAASNNALELAQGEFVALLDHDDELPEHALYMIAATLNKKPYLDIIYSDEDKINSKGERFNPNFKPDWNPDLLTAQNTVSHLGVYRADFVRSIGGFREGYEGSQDWDLALRISEIIPASHIHHIPHILYHWRTIKGSTSIGNDEKSYVLNASKKLLQDHLVRTNQKGDVSSTVSGYFRIKYDIPSPPPLVSIIIPTRNGFKILRRCIESIKEKTLYSNYEILIINNQSNDPETVSYIERLYSDDAIHLLNYNHPFNYSAINNYAVKFAKGDYICLMNNDIEVLSPEWLDEMLGHACRREIGAVGAMLYYPNDTIQHAGVVLGMGSIARPLYADHPRGTHGYKTRACIIQNLSAVTAACMVVKKSKYLEVDGLDEKNLPVSYNDVDFCLRLEERGYRNLWTPFAEFYHHESATRGFKDTIEKTNQYRQDSAYMLSRWKEKLENDPFINQNLTLNNNWPYPARTPRVKKPWLEYIPKQ
jgi:glycosyltransferase involved in cell wall biosynthesis